MKFFKNASQKATNENTLATPLYCAVCDTEYGASQRFCPKDGELLAPKDIPVADNVVGSVFVERYQVQSVLGEGGMSVVYKARHAMMDRFVAIKILKNFESSQDKMLKRFQQEARAASSLGHQNLITLHDFGISPDGKAYIVMDYLEGQSLEALIQTGPTASIDRLIRIFLQICDGLEHAHSKGVVHRDIKPSNIIVLSTADHVDWVKIVDFGIAKLMPEAKKETFHLTQAGQVFGSPLFMSPEQCKNAAIDLRTDIYSLGGTFYNAIAGRPPFQGGSLAEIVYQQLKEDPLPFSESAPNVEVPAALQAVIFKCLEKHPEARFQSMAELRCDLEQIQIQRRTAEQVRTKVKLGVVLAENSEEVHRTIADTLQSTGEFTLLGTAKNGEQTIDCVMQHLPQIALVNIQMPVISGTEATKQIKAQFPNMRILLYSLSEDYTEIVAALNCGADGFIFNDLSAPRLAPAMKAIVNGIPWVDPEITSRVLQASARSLRGQKAPDVSVKRVTNPNLNHAGFIESLAEIYQDEGKYDEAEALYHAAVALEEKAKGKTHADVVVPLTKLADLYMSRKKSAAAEQMYLRALEIRFQNLGPEHLDVAASLESLALLFKSSGGLIESERFYAWALRIREKLCSADDAQIKLTRTKLSAVIDELARSHS